MTELIPYHILKTLVEEADLQAVANVRAGRGGPFGASLNIIRLADMQVMRIGAVAGNAVLETGLGSAHAEDQALNPQNIAALKQALCAYNPTDIAVVVASSGESCPACHTKIEILARILIHEGLLAPGHFIVAYGASYADTLAIAGFNDAPYHADINQPEEARLIPIEDMDLHALPEALRESLAQGHAVVQMGDASHTGHHYIGQDQRHTHFTHTAEVSALRAAATTQKQQGHATPWDLQRAQLYTPADQIGPLTYTEAQWANIGRIIRVKAALSVLPEAPDTRNEELFKAVATRPYNNPHSVLRVVRVTPFANRGQHEWAALQKDNPDLKNYNGIST